MAALLAWKQRLIGYLERFISDLVSRSGVIAQRIAALTPRIEPLLRLAAQREARLLHILLEPLGAHTQARIETELGTFWGRDHRITIHATAAEHAAAGAMTA